MAEFFRWSRLRALDDHIEWLSASWKPAEVRLHARYATLRMMLPT